jgi:hypothetical protein
MVEYSFEEALDLLTNNLQNAENNLKNLNEDLDFLKNQITTMEVSILRISLSKRFYDFIREVCCVASFTLCFLDIARIYNYDVKLRRKRREQQAQQQPVA